MDTATDRELDALAVVERAFAAINALDLDSGMELIDNRMVYVNAPFTFSRTRLGVLQWIAAFSSIPGTSFELRNEHIAADGGTVLTDRTDILRLPGGLEFSIWCCGEHRVEDGRIVLWNDRFDYAHAATAPLRGIANWVLGRRA